MTTDIEELYETQLARLGIVERLRLLALLANGLATTPTPAAHSLLELEGLGAEVWRAPDRELLDAQQYVDRLRQEWEERP